jgi:N-acetyl-anhydromuramoyl-L-alanine amidase
MDNKIKQGWLEGARRGNSPHYDKRPESSEVSLIVVHNISLPEGEFGGPYVDQLFSGEADLSNRRAFETVTEPRVSAHIFINREGVVTQYVSFDDRAWHSGRSSFEGLVECNDYGIGIELEGTDSTPYTEKQYAKLSEITSILMYHFPAITLERLAGHCDIAPSRKTDPGESFDWILFRRLVEEKL